MGNGRWRGAIGALVALTCAMGCHEGAGDRLVPFASPPRPPHSADGDSSEPPADVNGPPPTGVVGSPPIQEPPPTPPPAPAPPPDPTPTPSSDGVPTELPGVYTDKGPAEPDAWVRGLVALPTRNVKELENTIKGLYDPASPTFRQYLSPAEWNDRFAPTEDDTNTVADWLKAGNLAVPRIASNRLLIEFSGKVADFNKAFGVTLHVLQRKATQAGNDPFDVYGFDGEIQVPKSISDRIVGLVAADVFDPTITLPDEGNAPVDTTLPDAEINGLTPKTVADFYHLTPLYERGYRGRGVKLGVVVGAAFRWKDVHAFWERFGVDREEPRVVVTMEAPYTRYIETTIDIEWASTMAPDADVIVYQGTDSRNTAMIYTFNEAIARGEVDVLTDSFAHREDSEPGDVRRQYSASAREAAALGITVVAASGDSAGVDVPACSPYVTAVGGTRLVYDPVANVTNEEAWDRSGSGRSLSFATPWWQLGAADNLNGRRGVVDVSLNAEMGYWSLYLGKISKHGGTSYASPVFAAMMAVVDQARRSEGKPNAGYLNPLLYTDPRVHGTFKDITAGFTHKEEDTTPLFTAHGGWDFPTGWGSPNPYELWKALP